MHSIYWFGFSADPPTLAHQGIVRAVLRIRGEMTVVVFPAGPLNYKKFKAGKRDRLQMIEFWWKSAQFPKNAMLRFFDFYRRSAFIWYSLWKKIQQRAPQFEHWFVVGSDQYQALEKTWSHGSRLLKEANFLIIPRPGYPIKSLRHHHRVLPMRPLSHSSTKIRKGSSEGLDRLTKAYILKKKLYVTRVKKNSSSD